MKLKPFKYNQKRSNKNGTITTTVRWAVDFPENFDKSSKKMARRKFKTLADAENFAQEMQKKIILCDPIKKVEGVCLMDELPILARAYEKLNDRVSLEDVVNFYVENNPKLFKSITLSQAIVEYLSETGPLIASREGQGYALATFTDVKSKLNIICKFFFNSSLKNVVQKINSNESVHGDFQLWKLSSQKIEEFLTHQLGRLCLIDNKNHNIDRNNHLKVIKSFLEWCKKEKKWIKINPAVSINKLYEPKGEIKFYTHNQIKLMLGKLRIKFPELIPAFVLMVFAGVRPIEVQRLSRFPWLIDVRNRQITLTKDIVKPKKDGTAMSRILEELPENIWLWLNNYKNDLDQVILNTSNINKKLRKIRIECGIDTVHDGARHAFATHASPYFENRTKVAQLMGHTNFNMLNKHYQGVVDKSTACEYFSIKPEKAYNHSKETKPIPSNKKSVNWPSNNTLQDMINTLPNTHIANKLKCSEAAVRKHCKKNNIQRQSVA